MSRLEQMVWKYSVLYRNYTKFTVENYPQLVILKMLIFKILNQKA